MHRIVPKKLVLPKNRVSQLHTPLSWKISKVLRAIQSPVELTETYVLSTHTRQQRSLTTPLCEMPNVKYEACKTHITKVLKQGTLVEDDAITQSGYNSMQAIDGSIKLSSNNGYKTSL